MDTFSLEILDKFVRSKKSKIITRLKNIIFLENSLKNYSDDLCFALDYSPKVINELEFKYDIFQLNKQEIITEENKSFLSIQIERKCSFDDKINDYPKYSNLYIKNEMYSNEENFKLISKNYNEENYFKINQNEIHQSINIINCIIINLIEDVINLAYDFENNKILAN